MIHFWTLAASPTAKHIDETIESALFSLSEKHGDIKLVGTSMVAYADTYIFVTVFVETVNPVINLKIRESNG